MKLLIFSDIHQDWLRLKEIVEQEAEIFICLGDFTTFGKGFEEAVEIFKSLGEKLWLLPGNSETEEQVKKTCKENAFTFFHQQVIKKGSFNLAGFGLSNPTPFNTPGDISEKEIERGLERLKNKENLILFTHVPPKGTELDLLPDGKTHVGSQTIRDFLDKEQPLCFFSGHVHENEGKIQQVGETTCFSVGKSGLSFWLS